MTERVTAPDGRSYDLTDGITGRLSRPASKAGRLQRAALACLLGKRDDGVLPTNARFVFYELEHTSLVRKPRQGETRRTRGFPAGAQDLGDALFQLRDRGVVPWSWLTDETRTLYGHDLAETVPDAVCASLARRRSMLGRPSQRR